MVDLYNSPYFGYILFSIVFTLTLIIITAVRAKREWKRVRQELNR